MAHRRRTFGIAGMFVVLLLRPGLANATAIGLLEQVSPLSAVYVQGIDFVTFSPDAFLGEGDVTAPLELVPGLGTAADFAGFTAGNIALILRGVLLFSDKVNNAALAGASGVLIYNNTAVLPAGGLFVAPTTIPALFITQALGQNLIGQLQSSPVEMHLAVEVIPEPTTAILLGTGLCLAAARRRLKKR